MTLYKIGDTFVFKCYRCIHVKMFVKANTPQANGISLPYISFNHQILGYRSLFLLLCERKETFRKEIRSRVMLSSMCLHRSY